MNIEDMTLNEIEAYVRANPEEGLKIALKLFKTSTEIRVNNTIRKKVNKYDN